MFRSISNPKKYKSASEVKSKAKALRHFKIDPALKIDTTFLCAFYTYITR